MCENDINNMDYQKFEQHISILNETLEREKKEHEKQQKESAQMQGNYKMPNFDNYLKNIKR